MIQEIIMKTSVNEQKTIFTGKDNKFADTPVFQVINDVGSSVRWISGQMVTIEFGKLPQQ